MHFDQAKQRLVDTEEELEDLDLDLELPGEGAIEIPEGSGVGTFGGETSPFGADLGHWLHGALKTIATPITAPIHLASKGAYALEKEAKKVPVFGGLFAGLVDVTLGGPWHLSDDIIHGVRMDKALLREFKRQLQDFKEVGPYAEMVFSFVPGFGTLVASGIGAGLALANGQPITQALLAGVAGAVPGGALAQEAFRVGSGVLQTATAPGGFRRLKNLEDIGLAALPIPDSVKKPMEGGLKLLSNLASGERVDKALAGAVVSALPAAVAGPLAGPLSAIQHVAISVPAVQSATQALQAAQPSLTHLPPAAQSALKAAQAAGVRLATGKHVDASIVEQALSTIPSSSLPPTVQNALSTIHQASQAVTTEANAAAQIANAASKAAQDAGGASFKPVHDALVSGAALGHGAGLQAMLHTQSASSPDSSATSVHGPMGPRHSPFVRNLLRRGDVRLARDRVARAGLALYPGENAWGYRLGLGLSTLPVGLGPAAALRRAAVSGRGAAGFDAALALSAGQSLLPTRTVPEDVRAVLGSQEAGAPPTESELAQAGYQTTVGLVGAPPETKTAVLQPLVRHPHARHGAARAVEDVRRARGEEGKLPWYSRWWFAIERFFEGLVDFL